MLRIFTVNDGLEVWKDFDFDDYSIDDNKCYIFKNGECIAIYNFNYIKKIIIV